jgi:hypothetical protein
MGEDREQIAPLRLGKMIESISRRKACHGPIFETVTC